MYEMNENEIIYSNIQSKQLQECSAVQENCFYCDHFWGGNKNCSQAPKPGPSYYTQQECEADTANQC